MSAIRRHAAGVAVALLTVCGLLGSLFLVAVQRSHNQPSLRPRLESPGMTSVVDMPPASMVTRP